MKTYFYWLLYFLFIAQIAFAQNFAAEQKKFERVREAYTQKEAGLRAEFAKQSLSFDNFNLLLISYKHERELQVWVKNTDQTVYKLLKTYPFCSSSGTLGPKRKMGDGQIPEGFYYIDRFNPTSSFHLSLGVSYPNSSDKKLSAAENLGGDIFIHGSCVTIGCIPITDELIKELYIVAVQAKKNTSKIPVWMFPFKMNKTNTEKFAADAAFSPETKALWNNLKPFYDDFEKNRQFITIKVNSNGLYMK